MPANFTIEEKEAVRKALFKKGYELLSQYGMKKLKIHDIARAVGIAAGTFYHFFPSKDAFISELIKARKRQSIENFKVLASKYPKGIPFKEMKMYLLNNLNNENIYRLLSQEDYNALMQKFNLSQSEEDAVEKTGAYIMSKLATDKTAEDFKLFSEAYKIIIIGTSDLTKLNTDVLNSVSEKLVESACKFLY
ncbi:TetR/AcrR family transcriptional regulator [Treponema pedis]|uniref:TetR/AcrR family transcriptional regulator n=1 Tax=Treponema pedis TaxID=409322 RepID=UPI00042354C4|nr:TetR/AcrR family transcriptional regulator [Treponema pedis]